MDEQRSKDQLARQSEMKRGADEQITEGYAKTFTGEDAVKLQDTDDNTKLEDTVLNVRHAFASSVLEQANECSVARSSDDGLREDSYVRDDESQAELWNQMMKRDGNSPTIVFKTRTSENECKENYDIKHWEENAGLSSFSRNENESCPHQNKTNYSSEDQEPNCGQKLRRYFELSNILVWIKFPNTLEHVFDEGERKSITPFEEIIINICALPDEPSYLGIREQCQNESIITLILRDKALRKAHLEYESFRVATFGVGNNQPMSVSVLELAENGFFRELDGTIVSFCCSCIYHPSMNRNHSLHLHGCERIHSLGAEGISIREQYDESGSWLLPRQDDNSELGVILRTNIHWFFGTVYGGQSGRENVFGQTVPKRSSTDACGTEDCPNQSQSATNVTPLQQAPVGDSYVQPMVPQAIHFDSVINVDINENRNPTPGIRNVNVSASEDTDKKQTLVTVESSANRLLDARLREENCQLSENFSAERLTTSVQGANNMKIRCDFPRDKESTESSDKNSRLAKRSHSHPVNTLAASVKDFLNISNPDDSCQNFAFSHNRRVRRKRWFSEADIDHMQDWRVSTTEDIIGPMVPNGHPTIEASLTEDCPALPMIQQKNQIDLADKLDVVEKRSNSAPGIRNFESSEDFHWRQNSGEDLPNPEIPELSDARPSEGIFQLSDNSTAERLGSSVQGAKDTEQQLDFPRVTERSIEENIPKQLSQNFLGNTSLTWVQYYEYSDMPNISNIFQNAGGNFNRREQRNRRFSESDTKVDNLMTDEMRDRKMMNTIKSVKSLPIISPCSDRFGDTDSNPNGFKNESSPDRVGSRATFLSNYDVAASCERTCAPPTMNGLVKTNSGTTHMEDGVECKVQELTEKFPLLALNEDKEERKMSMQHGKSSDEDSNSSDID